MDIPEMDKPILAVFLSSARAGRTGLVMDGSMRFKIIVSILSIGIYSILAAQAHAITVAQLVNEYPIVSQVTTSSDLVQKIRTSISQLIQKNTHRDYPAVMLFEDVNKIAFWKGEEIWSLAQVLPYLDATARTSLAAFLKIEVTNYLLSSTYRSFETQGALSTKLSDVTGVSWWQWRGVEYETIYGLWAYAQYTNDWDTIKNNWTQIQSFYTAINTSKGHKKYIDGVYARSRNSEIAGRIAYARMAKKLFAITGTASYQTIYQNEQSGLASKMSILDTQSSNGPYDDHICDFDGVVLCSNQPGRDSILHFVQYDFLTPELGRWMHDSYPTQTQQVVTSIESQLPFWYMNTYNIVTNGTGGEGYYQPPGLATEIFQAKAQILNQPVTELRPKLPWPHAFATLEQSADASMYRNLDTLIRRSETIAWTDTNTAPPAVATSPLPSPSLLPSPTPSASPLVGDFNSDGIVNTTDLKYLLSHWLSSGVTDLTGDGKTNALDAGVMMNQIH
jgi:hypothetical protein